MYAANNPLSPKYLENSAPLPPYFSRKNATDLLSRFYLLGHYVYCAYFLLLFTFEHLTIVIRDSTLPLLGPDAGTIKPYFRRCCSVLEVALEKVRFGSLQKLQNVAKTSTLCQRSISFNYMNAFCKLWGLVGW